MIIKFGLYKKTVSLAVVLTVVLSIFFSFPNIGYSETDTVPGYVTPIAYSSNDKKSDDIRYLEQEDNEEGLKTTKLGVDGSIYIHFDRLIVKGKQITSLEEATKLYKMPRADENGPDSTYDEKTTYRFYPFSSDYNDEHKIIPESIISDAGSVENVKDKIYEIDGKNIEKFNILEDLTILDQDSDDDDKAPLGMEKISIGKVEIVNDSILKITPKNNFEPLNKYGLWIDKGAIEGKDKSDMEDNLKLTFWIRADNKGTIAKWLKPEIKGTREDTKPSYKSYIMDNTPQYGPNEPIVLNSDNEVIPKAQDEILEARPDDLTDTRRISYDALLDIDLIDVYLTDMNIEKARMEKKEEYKEEAKEKAERKARNELEQRAIDNEEDFDESDFDREKFEKEFEDGYDEKFKELWENEFLPEKIAELKEDIKIAKFEFIYNFEDDIKKTGICLYPREELDGGKKYRLTVPEGTLETRSGNTVEHLNIDFVTQAKWDENDSTGVYFVEDNEPKVTDIWSEGEWTFKLFGYNFHETIERVELIPWNGNANFPDDPDDPNDGFPDNGEGEDDGKIPDDNSKNVPDNNSNKIVIDKGDIEFRGATELWVKIRGENVRKFISEDYTGQYKIILYFNNKEGTLDEDELIKVEGDKDNKEIRFNLRSKGHPEVKRKEPEGSSDKWFDEHSLGLAINPKIIEGSKRYFLKITFEDIDGKLEFDYDKGIESLLNASDKVVGNSASAAIDYLDKDFLQQISSDRKIIEEHIFNKDRKREEAYLYIPIKLLDPQATYNVTIPSGIVKNDASDVNEQYNEDIRWIFTTMATPSVTENGVIIQSIIEGYDPDEPLIIYGDFFYPDTIDVYFNNERADYVDFDVDDDGNQYLKIYLPHGRYRLGPGIYNIIVENSKNHQVEIVGTLSIVARGKHIPEDGYRIKEDNRYEKVVETVSRSEGTVFLDRYSKNSKIKLDLDELMGSDTLVRKVRFLDSSTIRVLSTYSKWANINLYNITIPGRRRDENYLYIGRVEAFLANSLKKALTNYNIKSDIIRVTGYNVDFDRLYIEIPYTNAIENRLKVLRYSETSRRWTEEIFDINYVDKKVRVTGFNPGMFVVVESKY
ncbi:MAG: hypothetical protein ACOCG5_03765 [Candidatus Alkaliphilus sp. MAG34]